MEAANKEMSVFNKKKYAIYLDKASIHYVKEVIQNYSEKVVKVIYGVPYSPEFNPIELFLK